MNRKYEEPTELDDDLEMRLLSVRNMVELALLALSEDRCELLPTAIEDAYVKLQFLMDDYCVED